MEEYKVIYEFGSRLFTSNRAFTDVKEAKILRDYFIMKGFDSIIVSSDYKHEMHAGFENYKKMISLGFAPDSTDRPEPLD